jgi:hypothetical protein
MIIREKDKLEALSTKYHADKYGVIPSLASGTSARRWEEMARMHIRDAKYSFKNKREDGFKPTMTTTVPLLRQIWLAHGWEAFTDHHKAVVLWHELVHVRQQRAMKAAKFSFLYSVPRGRWILEMQAYRMSIRIRLILGMGIQGEAERIAESMINNYGPWLRLDKDSIRSSTLDVLGRPID